MSNLNDFLKKNDLLLTLVNEQGEKYEAGPANHIRPLKTKTIIRWSGLGNFSNVFPFTYAVLHGERKIFQAMTIRPIMAGTESVIEMVY